MTITVYRCRRPECGFRLHVDREWRELLNDEQVARARQRITARAREHEQQHEPTAVSA